jgi:apolipoprotein N-acyltransferase
MKNYQLAILSAILFGLSFIDIRLGFLAFFAFVPYLAFVAKSNSKQSFWCGFLFGFVVTSITLYSIILVELIAFIGLLIILPLYFAVFTFLIKKVQIRFTNIFLWFFPIIWIAFEHFMTLGPLNFPWLNVGYSITNYHCLIQFADIFGIYGISFLILIINVLIYKFLLGRKKALIIIACIFVIWFGYGNYKDKAVKLQKENLKIGIVQISIPEEDKLNPALLDSTIEEYGKQLSILANKDSVDLVIFPESAIFTYLLHERLYKKRISNMTKTNNVNLVTGFSDYKVKWKNRRQSYQYFNSATMIDRWGNFLPKYDKIRLVPFGERIPLLSTFPILEKLQFGQANFEYGTHHRLYEINGYKFSITICFEGAFPELNRQYVNDGADFIVNITNDAWYKKTAITREHARNCIIRAVENRISILRAANTGISYIVNPKGKVLQRADIYQKKNISDFLFTTKSKNTFFGKAGFLFPKICFLLAILLIVYSILSNLFFTKGREAFDRMGEK